MNTSIKWKVAQKAELKWWSRYLGSRPKQSYLKWKRAYWNDLLNLIGPSIDLKNKKNILDIGCGPAGIYMVLKEHQVAAVDPLIEAYHSNLTHFNKSDYPHVSFFPSSLENFQTDAKFDLVFCLNAINHVSDIEVSFQQLSDFSKPGGKLVLSIDTHNFNFFKHLFRWLPVDVLHPHQYDLSEYSAMLEAQHYKILKTFHLKRSVLFDYHLLIAEKK